MKRLFQITDTTTGKRHGEAYYEQKRDAKRARESLNEEHGALMRFVVSPGPDHRKVLEKTP